MGIFNKKTNDLPGRRRMSDTERRLSSDPDDRQYIFARNRTLTGTTSQRFRDVGHSTDLQSPRSHAHHLALRRRKIGMVFLVVLGIAVVLFILLLQFTAVVTVSTSDTSQSKKLNESVYEKAINDYFGIHPLSRLRFALDKTDLKNYLASTVPEVADVTDISLGAIGDTNITLSMRHPVAGWTIDSKQYFVDANGIAFEQNYFADPSVQIVDNSGVALQQGTTVASNRFLGFVGRVVSLSKSRGYNIVQAIIPSGTTRQLEVVIQNVVPHVKLSIDRPAGEQVEDMDRALTYLKAHGQSPSYVDVRVSGKAFYK
ncbi:hypothetical protein EPN95_01235 [Patescibacteria group bacterium]|nr:MAG: hypothetical protein EPN95_01235 [Patescibacteria group bacterium]